MSITEIILTAMAACSIVFSSLAWWKSLNAADLIGKIINDAAREISMLRSEIFILQQSLVSVEQRLQAYRQQVVILNKEIEAHKRVAHP